MKNDYCGVQESPVDGAVQKVALIESWRAIFYIVNCLPLAKRTAQGKCTMLLRKNTTDTRGLGRTRLCVQELIVQTTKIVSKETMMSTIVSFKLKFKVYLYLRPETTKPYHAIKQVYHCIDGPLHSDDTNGPCLEGSSNPYCSTDFQKLDITSQYTQQYYDGK